MRLLLAEDERTLAKLLVNELRSAGFAVDWAANGEEANHLGLTETYDAIILDLGLPLLDGLSSLASWRKADVKTPVLILTARSDWHSKVQGLNSGADDYLTKPFEMPELLARIRALIRRSAGIANPVLRCGDIVMDTLAGKIFLKEEEIDLTALEFKIFNYLMHRQGKIVSRSELTEHIYAQDFDRDSNTIEVIIGRIRRKLGGNHIKTQRGLGYRLEAV